MPFPFLFVLSIKAQRGQANRRRAMTQPPDSSQQTELQPAEKEYLCVKDARHCLFLKCV